MCNKMTRNVERYAQEVVANKRNLEYWFLNGVRVAECKKNAHPAEGWSIGQSSYEDKRLVGIFANDHMSTPTQSELLMMFTMAEWEAIRSRVSNTLSSNAWRACLLANAARQRGLVASIRKVITGTGRSNSIFMEKVS